MRERLAQRQRAAREGQKFKWCPVGDHLFCASWWLDTVLERAREHSCRAAKQSTKALNADGQ